MKRSAIILIITIFISCSGKKQNHEIDILELHKIIELVIYEHFSKTSIILAQTMPNKKYDDSPSDIPPPPLTPHFHEEFFDMMIEESLIDSVEAKYMYNSIDSNNIFNLKQELLSKPIIGKSFLDSLFTNNYIDIVYNKIKKQFGTSCFLKIGTPIYNPKQTMVLLPVNMYCGEIIGSGHIFLLRKNKNKWIIIKDYGAWVS